MNSMSTIKSDLLTQAQAIHAENQQLRHQIERISSIGHKWYELYCQQIKVSMLLRTQISKLESQESSRIKLEGHIEKLRRKYLKKCYLLKTALKQMNEIQEQAYR